MNAVFNVPANEFDNQFLKTVKALFKGKHLSIAISDDDETEYLLSSEANREAMEKSFAAKEGYRFTPSEFKKLSDELLSGKKPDFSRHRKVQLSV